MRFLFYFLLLSSSINSFAQVRSMNIDSLLQHLSPKFEKAEDEKHLMKFFKVYKTPNQSDAIHIYYDPLNQPSEYIGLCVLWYKYDSLGRTTSVEGWNKKGEPYNWDFAALTTYEYSDCSNSDLIKKLQKTIPDFSSTRDLTFEMVVIRELNLEENKHYDQTDYKIRSTDDQWSFRYYAKPEKGNIPVCDSAWFVLKHHDERNYVNAEYFVGLDSNLRLGSHKCDQYYSKFASTSELEGDIPKFCIAKKIETEHFHKFKYYDENNNLVKATEPYYYGPINVPAEEKNLSKKMKKRMRQ